MTKSATDAELKKAYRKLAMECHPDRNPDDPAAEERFKEVSEAYAVLSDSDKRARYNQFGHAGVSGPGGGGHPGAAGFEDLGNFGDLFSDLFGDMFGGAGGRGGSRRGRGQRGADLRYNLEISLDDVLNGCEPNLKIPKMRRCEPCEGSGAAEGSTPSRCGRCEGTGQLVFQQGFFRVNRPCDACGGAITWPAHVQPRRASRCHACYREQARAVYRLGLPAMERRADAAAVRAMTAAHAAGRADTEASSVALWAAVEAALEAALEARRALRVAQRRRRRGASAAGPPRARVAPV